MIVVAIVLGLLGLAAAAASYLQVRSLKERFSAALGGQDAGSLEQSLAAHRERVEAVSRQLITLESEYQRLSITNSIASQKISIVRFNPFGDTGGDQSFSLAVLDAHDSGYVLSSIHGRQGTRVYATPIDLGRSKYQLSDEEQKALDQAVKRVPDLAVAAPESTTERTKPHGS